MLEFSKRLGLCLGIAAAFCLGACDDDSGSDKGKTNSGGDASTAECTSNDDCKDVEGKPVCDQDKKECVEEKKDDSGNEDGGGDGSEDGSGDGSGNDTASCSDGQEACGSSCTDLKTDNNNCGKCDNVCADGKTCKDSECQFVCEGDAPDKCEDGCRNFKTDNNNCGECGKKCDEGQACIEGKCAVSCESGQTACDDGCKDTLNDNENCGECGKKCTDGNTCQNGVCNASCEAGTERCGSDCINLDSDDSCGTCDSHPKCNTDAGEKCSANRICEGPCPDSEKPDLCGDVCVNLKTDPAHCGGCEGEDHVCGENKVCNDGKCVGNCEAGFVEFEGACISKTDPRHCGIGSDSREGEIPEGGIDCTSLPGVVEATCEADKCKISKCEDNYAVCDSNPTVCTNLHSADACGSCANKCNDENADPDKTVCMVNSEKLEESVCQYTCKEGMSSCGGKCLNLNDDKDNCGWCGNKCGDDATCVNGFCTISPDKCDDNGYVTTTLNGKQIKAYCIMTETDFKDVRDAINSGKVYPDSSNTNNAYIVMDDLVLGDQTSWKPIGTSSYQFKKGYFMGNGKTIKGNLTTTGSYVGLFGYVNSSIIDGFNLEIKLTANSFSTNAGGLVGKVYDSVIQRSVNKGELTISNTTSDYDRAGLLLGEIHNTEVKMCGASGKVSYPCIGQIGGLIGTTRQGTVIDNTWIDVELVNTVSTSCRTYDGTGALVGMFEGSSLSNSTAKGKITIKGGLITQIGGLVGVMRQGSLIENCSSSTEVSAPGSSYVGGLVGHVSSYVNISTTKPETIKNSSASGDITCGTYCGGIFGINQKRLEASNSFATGNITATGNYHGGFGGTVSSAAAFDKVYATGNVSSNGSYVGGLFGNISSSKITNSYATGNVTTSAQGGARIGGLSGNSNSNTYENVYAKGDVVGGTIVGGLMGWSCDTITNCASFGNAKCDSFGTAVGETAGALIGMYGCGYSMTNCMAVGDATGGNIVSAGIGKSGDSGVKLRNVYISGKTNGKTNFGAVLGRVGESGPDKGAASLSFKNTFYWVDSAEKAVGYGTPATMDISAFKYNNDKDAVLTENEARKLASSLGKEWVTTKCTLKSGPKGEVTIPVPKTLGTNICK